MISQELSQFTNFFCAVTVILFLAAIGVFIYFLTQSYEKRDGLYLIISGYLILFGICSFCAAFTEYDSKIILIQKVSPFTFLDQKGNLVYESKIPKEVSTVYEHGISSGYTVRNNIWVYRVGVKDEYSWEIANYDFILWIEGNQAALAANGIVSLNKDIETVTKNLSADFEWRRSFPGKTQSIAKFLVWPKEDIERARIEEYIFQ